jgi:NAD(P)H dehydrogenase (quinone)
MASTNLTKPIIHIIYYSTYNHILTLAKSIAEGVTAAGGDVKLFQIPETLSAEVLAKQHAAAKPEIKDIPIATHDDLLNCDGLIFGFPTRYGRPIAQFNAFWDTTGGLWATGKLVGKPYTMFTSSATQNGGQETTHLTAICNFVHHGMIYIPMGYTDKKLFGLEEIHGGSPYGASTHASGDGSRTPTKIELGIAEHQGKHFTGLAHALKLGKEVLAKQQK